MKRSVAILVGTRKAAYILRADAARKRWKREGPLFGGEPVFHLAYDQRDGESVYAACNFTWGGPKIRLSRDGGRTWTIASNPAFPEGSKYTFKRTWHIEPGHPSQPDVMWAGTEPAALFRSEDRGQTWTLMKGLHEHPTRERWEPGAGGECLHSVAIDAADPAHMWVGISAAGVFETTDGGQTWRPHNENARADFMPGDRNKKPEFGQCIHHLVAHPTSPGVRFMQTHCGTYWREANDKRWYEGRAGLPSDFGFGAAIHPHDDATAYVIPLEGMMRLAPPPGIAVYRTRDRGRSWKRLDRGLPRAALEVYREGLATDRLDPAGVYFGTANGEVWASPDEGRSWQLVADRLPPVLSVSTATIQ